MIKGNIHRSPNFRYWNDGTKLITEIDASANILLLKHDFVFVT